MPGLVRITSSGSNLYSLLTAISMAPSSKTASVKRTAKAHLQLSGPSYLKAFREAKSLGLINETPVKRTRSVKQEAASFEAYMHRSIEKMKHEKKSKASPRVSISRKIARRKASDIKKMQSWRQDDQGAVMLRNHKKKRSRK